MEIAELDLYQNDLGLLAHQEWGVLAVDPQGPLVFSVRPGLRDAVVYESMFDPLLRSSHHTQILGHGVLEVDYDYLRRSRVVLRNHRRRQQLELLSIYLHPVPGLQPFQLRDDCTLYLDVTALTMLLGRNVRWVEIEELVVQCVGFYQDFHRYKRQPRREYW